jgi:GNAT superfamily N-acetyltransferase
MSITTWKAQPDEAETVARLLIAFRNWWGRDWPSDNAFLAGVERLMADTSTEFLLCAKDADSPPVAVAQIRFRWGIWHASNDCWLEDLFVEEASRRQGVAKALVEFAVERATDRGCRRLELDVSEANTGAIAFYESLGFGFKSDPHMDLLMKLSISQPD